MSQLSAHNFVKGMGWPSPAVFYPVLKPFIAAGQAINTSVSRIASAVGKASRSTVHAFGAIAQAFAHGIGFTAGAFAHGIGFTASAFARAVGSIALAYLRAGGSIGLAFTNTAASAFNAAVNAGNALGRGPGRVWLTSGRALPTCGRGESSSRFHTRARESRRWRAARHAPGDPLSDQLSLRTVGLALELIRQRKVRP